MAKLSFISDDRLREVTQRVLDRVKDAELKVESDPEKNVLDPISAVFDSARSGISIEEWMHFEKSRQIQKALQNAIGTLHQEILGSLAEWKDTKAGGGIDLRSSSRKIIAEVKNKYNTMNSSSAEAVFHKMENHLRYVDKGFTAYVVAIVPKSPKRYDRPWSHSKKHAQLRDDIREIDGASFYDLASGEKGALRQVYFALIDTLAELTDAQVKSLSNDPQAGRLFRAAFGE